MAQSGNVSYIDDVVEKRGSVTKSGNVSYIDDVVQRRGNLIKSGNVSYIDDVVQRRGSVISRFLHRNLYQQNFEERDSFMGGGTN